MKVYLMHTVRAVTALLGVSLIAACGSDSEDTGGASGSGGGGSGRLSLAARNELIAKGVNKYFGKAPPSGQTTNAFGDTVYSFDPATGPVCFKGEIFKIVVHETSSQDLLSYLEGGGACWSDLCAAKEKATEAVPKTGLLDQDASKNVVGDWNIVYVSYCDGSVFSGDNDTTGPDGTPWKFHGLQNLSAAIDVAKSRFPAPKRILLAGSSAGGYGTLAGTGVVRLQYPDTDLFVFNDAGVGLSNPDKPSMLEHIKADWKFDQFVPDSCTECKTGQQTAIISWGLKNDTTLKASAFSAYEDSTIAGTFLGMTGPAFKALLLAETGKVHDAFPTRFNRFFIAGTDHTALLATRYYGSTINGVTLADFTRGMIEGTPSWTDSLEGGGY
jgi:hypothetical protein